MNTVLMKYQSLEHEYLVYDTVKYHDTISAHTVRSICSRNCALASSGIVAGPYVQGDGSLKMKVFSPDGREMKHDREAERAGISYLQDAGYLGGRQSRRTDAGTRAKAVGKIFLAEDFFSR